MAFENKSMVVFFMMVLSFFGVCLGAVYKVGDSCGWTENGKVDYKAWSNSKTFHVGDTIVFEYDNRLSNVVRVNHHDYNACNNIHSYFSLNSGNDSFVIPRTGHFYFISGLADHCRAGQRVDFRVPKDTATSAPSPAHSPPPTQYKSSPPPTHYKSSPPPAYHAIPPSGAPQPAAKKKNGAVSISGMWLAMVTAICVCFYWL